MYIEAIKFKREEKSEWEEGYYIGKYENCKDSVILDKNYQAIEKDKNGLSSVWDYQSNLDNWIKLRIPEND
ncbi:TPA: hypothetical protein ACXDAZ_002672 [Clostridium botulinum]